MATKQLTQREKDIIQDLSNRGLLDPTAMTRAGKLNPGAWDGGPNEVVKYAARWEGTRNALIPLLNEHEGYNGRYRWEIAPFREEEDLPEALAEGWVPMTELMFDWLTAEIRKWLGLIIVQGCVCWPGRGGDKPHIVCVMREDYWKQKNEQQQDLNEERLGTKVKDTGVPDGKGNTQQMEITEEQKEIPRAALAGGDMEGTDENT